MTRRQFLGAVIQALVPALLAACGVAAPAPGQPAPVHGRPAEMVPATGATSVPADHPIDSSLAALTPQPAALVEEMLTVGQRQALNKAALSYVTLDASQTLRAALEAGLLSWGDGLHCLSGPLALAILCDAGLIDPYVELKDRRLVHPRAGQIELFMESVFARQKYEWRREETPLNRFDFSLSPLLPGDVLFLLPGKREDLYQLLTVTRVDEDGRAYSVTTLETADGFIIDEGLLYDSSSPGQGWFYTWADRRRGLGVTGSDGFFLWRPAAAVSVPGEEHQALAGEIDAIFNHYGGYWHGYVKEVSGPIWYRRKIDETLHPASTIKLPQAMLVLEALRRAGVEDFRDHLRKRGTAGRSYEQLLRAMLVNSEESATQDLLEFVKLRLNPLAVLEGWGALRTRLEPRRSTLYEMSILFEGLYEGRCLPEDANAILLEMLNEYTSNDDTRLGAAMKFMPPGSRFYNKRGTLTEDQLIVADLAIFETPAKAYLAGFYGYQSRDGQQTTYERLQTAIEESGLVLAAYFS